MSQPLPKPFRKPLPGSFNEPARIEVPDHWRPQPYKLDDAPVIEHWRRLGTCLTGVLDSEIATIPGVIVKLYVRGGWVLMDDGKLYRLGGRAYAGT